MRRQNDHNLCRIRRKGAALIAVALLMLLGQPTAAYAETAGLRAVGNKVLTANGQQYIPEGISIYGGLEAPDYDANTTNNLAQIQASFQYWHANTVRLQVAESNLFSQLKKGQTYNPRFMAALSQQVNYAQSLGMAVVINDQTEFTSNSPSPTTRTSRFWRVVATHFKSSPYVIFDIFNEPRLTSSSNINRLASDTSPSPVVSARLIAYHEPAVPMNQKQAWKVWRNGGSVNGTVYVGMQTLVNQIRDTGASNLIWVEGTYGARRLPPKEYLLYGSNLVYAIHHPNLNNPRSWHTIGRLAAVRPVVEGEWAQYESSWAECYSHAYTNAPKYLSYLHAHNIGIIAWSLQANSLLQGKSSTGQPHNLNPSSAPKLASELATPNELTPSYACGNRHGQGVGQLLQNYFARNSTTYQFD